MGVCFKWKVGWGGCRLCQLAGFWRGIPMPLLPPYSPTHTHTHTSTHTHPYTLTLYAPRVCNHTSVITTSDFLGSKKNEHQCLTHKHAESMHTDRHTHTHTKTHTQTQ